MTQKNIDEILESQRKFFSTGATLPVAFRIEMLKQLYNAIKSNEKELGRALTSDLGKANSKASCVKPALFLQKSVT